MARILFFLLATQSWAGEILFLNESLRMERVVTTELDRLLSRAVLEGDQSGTLGSLCINDPFSTGETNSTLLAREEPLLHQQFTVYSLGDIADNAGFLQVALRRWFDFEQPPAQRLDPPFESPSWKVQEQRVTLLALIATLSQVTGSSELMAGSERLGRSRVYAPVLSRLIATLVALDGRSGSPTRADFLFLTNRLWAFALLAQTLNLLPSRDPNVHGLYQLTKQMTQELVVSFESHYSSRRKVNRALDLLRVFLLHELRGQHGVSVAAFDEARSELRVQRRFYPLKYIVRRCQALFPDASNVGKL